MPETDPFIIHFNARIHAMKSRLFTRPTLEEMLSGDDLSRMSESLLESTYRTELAEALTRYQDADAIEEAIFRNLVATFQKLVQRAQGDFREYVRIFLTRWDLAAVKSLLRCRHQGMDSEMAVDSLIPGPTLSVALLRDLAKLDSMEGLVAGLVGWNGALCRSLLAPLETYRDSGNLAAFEEALDRAYFVGNIRDLPVTEDGMADVLRLQLRGEVDRINLRLIFQHLGAGDDTADNRNLEDQLLTNGTLPQSVLQNMANAGNVATAVDHLSTTRYRNVVEEIAKLLQSNQFSRVERLFERLMMTQIRRQSRQNIFGFGPVMDYAWLKYNEAVNLRLIARGLAGHLPVDRVKDEMYFAA